MEKNVVIAEAPGGEKNVVIVEENFLWSDMVKSEQIAMVMSGMIPRGTLMVSQFV